MVGEDSWPPPPYFLLSFPSAHVSLYPYQRHRSLFPPAPRPQISDYITRSPPLWRPPVCHTRLSSYCLSFIALLICLITLWYQSNLTENAFGRGAERKKTDRQWCSCIFGSIHMFPAFPHYLMMNMNGQVKWNDDDIFGNTCVWGAAADDNNNNKKKKIIFSPSKGSLFHTISACPLLAVAPHPSHYSLYEGFGLVPHSLLKWCQMCFTGLWCFSLYHSQPCSYHPWCMTLLTEY